MWTVVYMAQSKEIATTLQELLTKEGILVKLRPISKNHDNSDNYYEVLVPKRKSRRRTTLLLKKATDEITESNNSGQTRVCNDTGLILIKGHVRRNHVRIRNSIGKVCGDGPDGRGAPFKLPDLV